MTTLNNNEKQYLKAGLILLESAITKQLTEDYKTEIKRDSAINTLREIRYLINKYNLTEEVCINV
jgi:hypothetical protein